MIKTNRSLGNFSEYALKSSENQRFSSPKFFATQKTFLITNIKSAAQTKQNE